MRTLRVALIIATLDRAGAEKQLALLARGLNPERFDVSVFALTRGGPWADDLRQRGISVTVLDKAFKYDARVLPRLGDLLTSHHIDIAYTWMFTANAFGRTAARYLANVPVVIAGEQDTGARPVHHDWIDRFLGRRSDAIVANSEGVRRYGLRRGWPAEKVRVIHAGIDLDEIETSPQLVKPVPDVPPGHTLAVTACRLTAQKGLRYLIWAVGILRHAKVPVRLWIVGDGPERGLLEEEVDRLDVREYVSFLGARNDVPAILQRGDMFVLPSLHEGMSNAVLEAMLSGVPVVVSDVAGMEELVGGGRYGMLVEAGYPKSIAAGIYQTLAHADDARRRSEEGREWVRNTFNSRRFIARHEALFRELAEARGIE